MSRAGGARGQRLGEPLQILRWRSRSQAFVEQIDGLKLTMLKIPAGRFLMGSSEGEEGNEEAEAKAGERGLCNYEDHQESVELAEFLMGQAPITQAQWRVVAGWQPLDGESWGRKLELNPSRFQTGDNQRSVEVSMFVGEANTDQRPVERVSWEDAIEFCNRLSQRTGQNYSLPSEAQWEYACRAGSSTAFHFGETISPELANFDGNYTYGGCPKGNYRRQTTPVGMFPANAWGLKDMHGNVWEWCLDEWFDNFYVERLLRGGSWYDRPWLCRSASRLRRLLDLIHPAIGLRVVCLPQGYSS